MTLTRSEVIGAIRSLLPGLERRAEFVRLVGTASSLLRGIELPAGDVDILAASHAVVDQLARVADDAGGECIAAPRWLDTPFGGQYIADYEVHGVQVEFSTVELSGAPDASFVAECAGDAPWRYFDTIDVEDTRSAWWRPSFACSPSSLGAETIVGVRLPYSDRHAWPLIASV